MPSFKIKPATPLLCALTLLASVGAQAAARAKAVSIVDQIVGYTPVYVQIPGNLKLPDSQEAKLNSKCKIHGYSDEHPDAPRWSGQKTPYTTLVRMEGAQAFAYSMNEEDENKGPIRIFAYLMQNPNWGNQQAFTLSCDLDLRAEKEVSLSQVQSALKDVGIFSRVSDLDELALLAKGDRPARKIRFATGASHVRVQTSDGHPVRDALLIFETAYSHEFWGGIDAPAGKTLKRTASLYRTGDDGTWVFKGAALSNSKVPTADAIDTYIYYAGMVIPGCKGVFKLIDRDVLFGDPNRAYLKELRVDSTGDGYLYRGDWARWHGKKARFSDEIVFTVPLTREQLQAHLAVEEKNGCKFTQPGSAPHRLATYADEYAPVKIKGLEKELEQLINEPTK